MVIDVLVNRGLGHSGWVCKGLGVIGGTLFVSCLLSGYISNLNGGRILFFFLNRRRVLYKFFVFFALLRYEVHHAGGNMSVCVFL